VDGGVAVTKRNQELLMIGDIHAVDPRDHVSRLHARGAGGSVRENLQNQGSTRLLATLEKQSPAGLVGQDDGAEKKLCRGIGSFRGGERIGVDLNDRLILPAHHALERSRRGTCPRQECDGQAQNEKSPHATIMDPKPGSRRPQEVASER